ncbi:hypothetical protein OTB20_21655 [Streptomyces sp. H27-H1]|uniref:hypothetical protein n=1 Tax=Streptomyces sp. H27-H1 TaxID=2996461 RepID=UPI00227008EC|nr:hypothetical protein [Streptomyces sp. H27-H1]MCY0928765.1 hypothetical protein [Streptomyces sp. H27-H1]
MLPISEAYVPEALAVSGLDRDRLLREGAEPAVPMAEFRAWVREVSAGAQPVMCAYPASFDWTFLYWYLLTSSPPWREGIPSLAGRVFCFVDRCLSGVLR